MKNNSDKLEQQAEEIFKYIVSEGKSSIENLDEKELESFVKTEFDCIGVHYIVVGEFNIPEFIPNPVGTLLEITETLRA